MSEPLSDAHGLGRLPLLRPDQLDADQRMVYDAIAGGPRAAGPFSVTDDEGRLMGPFNALLHHPGVGAAVEQVGAALRFAGVLDGRTRELVVCSVAAHWDSAYEWYAHRRVALTVGVTEAELDAVGAGRVPEGLAPAEESAVQLALCLLHERAVSDAVHDAAAAHHGPQALVEVASLVGYYQLLAGLLATAAVPAPEEESP